MKKIILILESGEEILCGQASSLYNYLLTKLNQHIVPLHGNREYALVKNLYSEEYDQFVVYKAEQDVQ